MTNTITLPRSVLEQALEALSNTGTQRGKQPTQFHAEGVAIKAIRAALEQGSGVLNQCDGCMQGAPLRGIFHTDESGKSFMTCQKRKYTHPQNLNCKSNQHRLATLWGYEKPQPPRQPLTDEQINDHRIALAYDSEDLPDPWDFKQGVRAAERAHGIGGDA